MQKPIIDSYDEFNFMVVLLFLFFVLMTFIIIIITNFKSRAGFYKKPFTTQMSISNETPQTTDYQYNYYNQLSQYIHPTQAFY